MIFIFVTFISIYSIIIHVLFVTCARIPPIIFASPSRLSIVIPVLSVPVAIVSVVNLRLFWHFIAIFVIFIIRYDVFGVICSGGLIATARKYFFIFCPSEIILVSHSLGSITIKIVILFWSILHYCYCLF